MAEFAQIRDGRVRLIATRDERPLFGDWVDITNITPKPQVGWAYDGGTSFRDLTAAPLPESGRQKAIKIIAGINKTELLKTDTGKALAALLLLHDIDI